MFDPDNNNDGDMDVVLLGAIALVLMAVSNLIFVLILAGVIHV